MNVDPLLLHCFVPIFNKFSSVKPFQGLGDPTHHTFIFEDEVNMEMIISTIPADKLTFAVKQSILEVKKIPEKEIIPVHQRMEMKITIYPIKVFEFGFVFYTFMFETKICLDLIQSCPNFEMKLCLNSFQSCSDCFLNKKSTVSIDLIDLKFILGNI